MWALRIFLLSLVAGRGEILDALTSDACGAECSLSALQVKASKGDADDTSGGYCYGTSNFCATPSRSTCEFWSQKGCSWVNWAPNLDGESYCAGSSSFCRTNDRSNCNFWSSQGCVWTQGGWGPHQARNGGMSCVGTSMFCSTTSQSTCEFWKSEGCRWVRQW